MVGEKLMLQIARLSICQSMQFPTWYLQIKLFLFILFFNEKILVILLPWTQLNNYKQNGNEIHKLSSVMKFWVLSMQVICPWYIWWPIVCQVAKGFQSSCHGPMGGLNFSDYFCLGLAVTNNYLFYCHYIWCFSQVVLFYGSNFYVLSGDKWSLCRHAIGRSSSQKQG